MNNNNNRKKEDDYNYAGAKEALRGLFWGVGMMTFVFLIVHFVIGIPAFQ
ncbi:hypothetical protein [Alkalicoccus luteus]